MTVTIGGEGFSFCASLWKHSHLYYFLHISHHLYLILVHFVGFISFTLMSFIHILSAVSGIFFCQALGTFVR